MFSSIYNNKKVLITGHTGFVGSWLSLWLKRLQATVIGYSIDIPTEPSLFKLINLDNLIDHHYLGDVRDADKLTNVFKAHQPDIVFHLAAQPLVRISYDKPVLTYETNVMGTVNVLEAVRKTDSVKVCVVITSDKCYDNKEWAFGYRETDALGGYDPYSSSKGCAEMVVAAYRKSFFNCKKTPDKDDVAISSVRAGNIIGGGDWGQDRLIPDVVRALSEAKKVIIRNPKSTRPWQFVLEPLSGYLHLGAMMWRDRKNYSCAWNLGPSDGEILTVEEVVSLFLREWDNGEYETSRDNDLHEANLLKLDTSKANYLLKWRFAYNIYEAIKETAAWYKKYYCEKHAKIFDLSTAQIDDYVNRARKSSLIWTNEK